jgi:XTP/dITP diphosphohydrolase
MMRHLLYATTNPGKIMELGRLMQRAGIAMRSPVEIGLALDVDEHGATLEENAALKARAYLDHLVNRSEAENYVVLADDTGVEIDALGGEPGIKVRRWNGSARMSDDEVLTTCLQRMAHVPPGQRGAQFRTVFALGVAGQPLEFFDGVLRGELLTQPDPLRIPGFPFESIFYVPEWHRLLGKIHELPADQKAHLLTHRDHAMNKALPRLRALLE